MDNADALKGATSGETPQVGSLVQEQMQPTNEATNVSKSWLDKKMSISRKGAILSGLGVAGLGALTALGVVSFPVNPLMSVVALGALPGQAYTLLANAAETFRPIVNGILGRYTSASGAFINPPRR